MGEALEVNTALTTLQLACTQNHSQTTDLGSTRDSHKADNLIGDRGAIALGQALRTNTTLTALDLSRLQTALNYRHKKGCLVKSAQSTGNMVTDRGEQALQEALHVNTALTQLELL